MMTISGLPVSCRKGPEAISEPTPRLLDPRHKGLGQSVAQDPGAIAIDCGDGKLVYAYAGLLAHMARPLGEDRSGTIRGGQRTTATGQRLIDAVMPVENLAAARRIVRAIGQGKSYDFRCPQLVDHAAAHVVVAEYLNSDDIINRVLAGIAHQQDQDRAQAAALSVYLVRPGYAVQLPPIVNLADAIRNVDDANVVTAILSHDAILGSEMSIFTQIADWSRGNALRLSGTVACVRLNGLSKVDLVDITKRINQIKEPIPASLEAWIGRAQRCISGRSDLDARPPRSLEAETLGSCRSPRRRADWVTAWVPNPF